MKSWPARLIVSGEKASGVHPAQREGLAGAGKGQSTAGLQRQRVMDFLGL